MQLLYYSPQMKIFRQINLQYEIEEKKLIHEKFQIYRIVLWKLQNFTFTLFYKTFVKSTFS